MNNYYHFPDGTDTEVRPEAGQICKVPSHKKGKFCIYQWDDEDEEWYIIPDNFTDPSVIDKSKEIMKIGKYANLRPKKKQYFYSYDEYSMYPYGPAMVQGTYPWQREAHVPSIESASSGGEVIDLTTEQYKNIIQDVIQTSGLRNQHHRPIDGFHAMRHSVRPTLNVDNYVSCECGALYTSDMHNHSEWCPRYEHDKK